MIRQADLPIIIVDKITKTRSVDDGKAETDTRKRWLEWRLAAIQEDRVVTRTDVLYGNGLGSFSIWGGRFLRGIRVVLTSVLIKVDFPKPDSPRKH